MRIIDFLHFETGVCKKNQILLQRFQVAFGEMKIEIIDDSSFPLDTGNNRIEEIDDIIEVDTCFICNGTPSATKKIYPEKGKKKL